MTVTTISDEATYETKVAWSIPGWCRDFDGSRSQAYALIGQGIFIAKKNGSKTMLTGDSVRAWWEGLRPAAIKSRSSLAV